MPGIDTITRPRNPSYTTQGDSPGPKVGEDNRATVREIALLVSQSWSWADGARGGLGPAFALLQDRAQRPKHATVDIAGIRPTGPFRG